MSYAQILFEKDRAVATITLNRPEKLNAYSETMVHEILAALADARDDDEIRAVILTATGKGFCAGGDIGRDFQYPARYRGHRLESMLEMRENMHVLIRFLHRFDKPVIAAINGAAVAGGLTLALACDFRIAAESARLGDTSLKFALIPDEGGAYFFPRFMGHGPGVEDVAAVGSLSGAAGAGAGTGDGSSGRCGVDGRGSRAGGAAGGGSADRDSHHQADDVQAADDAARQRAGRCGDGDAGGELYRRREGRHGGVSREAKAAGFKGK